jgi:hypothetical protein
MTSKPGLRYRYSENETVSCVNLAVWAAKQDDQPTRAEAIRRLVELGLKAKGK